MTRLLLVNTDLTSALIGQLIHAGDSSKSMAGINQFVTFLSEKEDLRK